MKCGYQYVFLLLSLLFLTKISRKFSLSVLIKSDNQKAEVQCVLHTNNLHNIKNFNFLSEILTDISDTTYKVLTTR